MAGNEAEETRRCYVCGRTIYNAKRRFLGSFGFACSKACVEFGEYYGQVPDPYEAAMGEIRRCRKCGIRFSYWPWDTHSGTLCHSECNMRRIVYVRARDRGVPGEGDPEGSGAPGPGG